MHRHTVAALMCGLFLAGFAPVLAAESAVYGRWDVNIGDRAPAWLGVQEKDGATVASFLWGGGSPHEIKDAKIEGNTITFKSHDHSFSLKAEGDTLTGTAARGTNEPAKVTGRRFIPAVDVSGTWKIASRQERAGNELKLEQKGDQITGTMGPRANAISDAKLENGVLTFTFGRGGKVKATVQGDRMAGEITRPRAQEGAAREFTATRQREWAEPVELINGKDTNGWKPIGQAESFWKVVDGCLSNTGRGGANIMTEKKFRDFKLHVEFRVPEHSNSGVYLRGRYEIQVEDSFGKEPQPGMCGALYGRIVPKKNASKKAGEWQTFDVTLIGNYVTVVHNGQTIIDNQEIDGITGGALDNDENAPGPFYLQGDHGPVDYRKFTVWPAK